MSTTQELLKQYEGQLVPYSFYAGFVCLSYAVSLIGTCSTLELIRRRTSHKGVHNMILLVGAAISMGGIAIWSMHFIGNRAIYILNGEEDLQIAYSTRLTVVSLFVPILVLILAFLAVGGNGQIRWWRMSIAGLLSGGAICGMHYIANASISNYGSIYQAAYVVGAALIAVFASTAALALFFVFEAAWKNVWWKRIGCAMVLAGAVSGMHWCASVGTSYRLISLYAPGDGMSRRETVIVVILLSVAACIVMIASAIYSGWVRRDYASKSQQVVLAAAVFDDRGRIMVNQEGFLPSEVVTDTFLPKSNNDVFGTAHPLFHWMFRASRNWICISNILDKITNHIAYFLSQENHNSRRRIKLVGEDGSLVQHYDIIVCELFCLAAVALASKMKEPLTRAGILWDEIFATGDNSKHVDFQQALDSDHALNTDSVTMEPRKASKAKPILDGLAEKGLVQRNQEYGRGCLMFLVRHVDGRRDMEKLEAAGYRFAEVHQVEGSIRSSMQINTPDLGTKLRAMSGHSEKNAILGAGVHLGIFAVRARLDHGGFDVLVQKKARNLLPTAALPLERLETWQLKFLEHLQRMTPSAITQKLTNMENRSPQEANFASCIIDAISSLRKSFDDAAFEDSTLMTKVVQVPCLTREENPRLSTCSLVAFRLVFPIHRTVRLQEYEFSPLQFFKIRQLVYEGSLHHVEFSHIVHRELSSALHQMPAQPHHGSNPGKRKTSLTKMLGSKISLDTNSRMNKKFAAKHSTKSQERLSAVTSDHGTLYNPSDDSSVDSSQKVPSTTGASPMGDIVDHKSHPRKQNKQLFGGIMVSQEIRVNVQEQKIVNQGGNDLMKGSRPKSGAVQPENTVAAIAAGESSAIIEKEAYGSAFIDELLALCMDKRVS